MVADEATSKPVRPSKVKQDVVGALVFSFMFRLCCWTGEAVRNA